MVPVPELYELEAELDTDIPDYLFLKDAVVTTETVFRGGKRLGTKYGVIIPDRGVIASSRKGMSEAVKKALDEIRNE